MWAFPSAYTMDLRRNEVWTGERPLGERIECMPGVGEDLKFPHNSELPEQIPFPRYSPGGYYVCVFLCVFVSQDFLSLSLLTLFSTGAQRCHALISGYRSAGALNRNVRLTVVHSLGSDSLISAANQKSFCSCFKCFASFF